MKDDRWCAFLQGVLAFNLKLNFSIYLWVSVVPLFPCCFLFFPHTPLIPFAVIFLLILFSSFLPCHHFPVFSFLTVSINRKFVARWKLCGFLFDALSVAKGESGAQESTEKQLLDFIRVWFTVCDRAIQKPIRWLTWKIDQKWEDEEKG